MQNDVFAKVEQRYQAAMVQSDPGQRIQGLLQTQELLLHADTSVETLDACIDQFLGLQADPQPPMRRFVAHFIENLLRFKPSFTLKCLPVLLMLLQDTDGKAKETAARTTSVLHPRALYHLAMEEQVSQFQRCHEQLQEAQGLMREILLSGCSQQPKLFSAATRWARVYALTQTPSPLAMKIRVPVELRGVSCLQEFPMKARDNPKMQQLDLNGMRQQAEDLIDVICGLVEQPPKQRWSKSHITSLVRCMSCIGRQRPMFLQKILNSWSKLLVEVNAAVRGKALGPMSVVPADAPHLQHILRLELQTLLASQLAIDRHGEIAGMLHDLGHIGSVEDLTAQAKYHQIRITGPKQEAPLNEQQPAKRRRLGGNNRKLAWTAEGSASFGDADYFDADAVLSGEVEETYRRFEDYFGIPSQREPGGHVPGHALLVARSRGDAELARMALMSLNSLPEKRTQARDKVHERIVTMATATQSARTSAVAAATAGSHHLASSMAGGDDQLSALLGPDVPDLGDGGAEGEAADPRSAQQQKVLQLMDASAEAADAAGIEGQLMAFDTAALQLPADSQGRDALQLELFQQLLEASLRLSSSLLSASLSDVQRQSFDYVYRQVSLHLASSVKLGVNPDLQRAMCRCFMTHAFDTLKAGTDGRQLQIQKLVELFYAKFSADVARAKGAGASAPSAQAIQEIIEGGKNGNSGGFSYAELFQMFLNEFERRSLPKKELRNFLNEIPAVPVSAFAALEVQCQQGPTRKMALLTILALLEGRPSCRWQCLHLLFKLAYSSGEDASLRLDTIRLLVNKVYSAEGLKPKRWQLPHLSDDEASPLLAKDQDAEVQEDQQIDFPALQLLRGRFVEDVATLMLRSMAPSSAKFTFTVQVPQHIEDLLRDVFSAGVCEVKDRVWLYLALCIKRPVLLHSLVETFLKCEKDMKEHLINSIEEAIKHIPATEPELLVLVQKSTGETERLVLKVLHILTSPGKDALSRGFGEAVTRLYGETQNPRLLVPVFGLLERRRLLAFLPAMVQLEQDQVNNAFQQLIRSKAPPLSISELLTELHHLNKPNENIVPVKFSMQALNAIFEMRSQFDVKVYGIVIQSLVEEAGSLPTLFMRTVIQVVKEMPRLCDFVVTEILPRLVRQDVWNDGSMWKGFVLVLQHTFMSQPVGAARVLALLPIQKLEDVLVQHPDWKAHLREFASKQPWGSVPPHVRQLLQ